MLGKIPSPRVALEWAAWGGGGLIVPGDVKKHSDVHGLVGNVGGRWIPHTGCQPCLCPAAAGSAERALQRFCHAIIT